MAVAVGLVVLLLAQQVLFLPRLIQLSLVRVALLALLAVQQLLPELLPLRVVVALRANLGSTVTLHILVRQVAVAAELLLETSLLAEDQSLAKAMMVALAEIRLVEVVAAAAQVLLVHLGNQQATVGQV
jgi:hypothetical protein